jgi:hypothetical protein
LLECLELHLRFLQLVPLLLLEQVQVQALVLLLVLDLANQYQFLFLLLVLLLAVEQVLALYFADHQFLLACLLDGNTDSNDLDHMLLHLHLPQTFQSKLLLQLRLAF